MSASSELMPPAPPAPKKKRKRAKAKRAAPAKAAPASVCAGITTQKCCDGCNPDTGCVITRGGTGVCAHPHKCGLPSKDSLDPAAVKRFAEARKILGHAAVERKHA